MCQMCDAFGLKTKNPAPAAVTTEAGPELKRNDDGTFTLHLTERQFTNLMLRLALSEARGL